MSAIANDDIKPADLEAKMRELQGEVETTATSAKEYVLVAGAVAAVAVIGIAFLLGRRRGKKKSTVVEVRRL
jgi:hypothetical protein